MTVSIVHIGLPLDRIPPEEQPKIAKRLTDLRHKMRAAGYHYEILHASPEGGLDSFRDHLKSQPCDGLILGGGLIGDPELSYFMEQIIDATRDLRPKAKIMFYNHATDIQTIVERWFKPGP